MKAPIDLREWIGKVSDHESDRFFDDHYHFLATDLLRTIDVWDHDRVGYTVGRNPGDYVRYLVEEIEEFIEKPLDFEEMADVVVYADRLFFHPKASDGDKDMAVRLLIDFVDMMTWRLAEVSIGLMVLPKGYEQCQTVAEIILRKVERNCIHYDRAIAGKIDVGISVGGPFLRRIRDQFNGGKIPFWEQEYKEFPNGSLKVVNGVVEVRTSMSDEQTEWFNALYTSDEVVRREWDNHRYGNHHGRKNQLLEALVEAGVSGNSINEIFNIKQGDE